MVRLCERIVEFPMRGGWPNECEESRYLNRRIGDTKNRIDVVYAICYTEEKP